MKRISFLTDQGFGQPSVVMAADYTEEEFAHMSRLKAMILAAPEGSEERAGLMREMEVIHSAKALLGATLAPAEARDWWAKARNPAGRYTGADPTDTERESGEAVEADREGRVLRHGGAMHLVLTAYRDGGRRTAYEASLEVSDDWHAKRRESERLMQRGFLRKDGTKANLAPAGRPHVDAFVITETGRSELDRLEALNGDL